jgi:hypothetical protein
MVTGDYTRAHSISAIVPGHCDRTVNLYDWIACVRDAAVEAVWPISALRWCGEALTPRRWTPGEA